MRETGVPTGKETSHLPAQWVPSEELTSPVPSTEMLSTAAAASWMKVAVTSASAFAGNAQSAAPEQAPLQALSCQPAAACAVRVVSPTSGAVQLWLHRTSIFLFVLISAVAGVLLVILPWTPEWTDNYLLLSSPWLRTVVTTGFFRGLCSGLGLLDIWIGFWEALHYHEHR